MTDSSPINRHRNWNALARTPDGLSTHVVATIDGEIVASACGLESDDWSVVEQDDGPVRLCGTCANHFGGAGPQPIAFQDPVALPVDGVDVGPIGTKATFTEAYGEGR
jgi:hypothetical protein